MRTERVVPLIFSLFLFVPPAVAQSRVPVEWAELLPWVRDLGILAVGWGTGVTGWLVTGHQAMSCLFVDMPRAWMLWRKEVLTSRVPVYKYLLGGGLLIVLGVVLASQLWDFWEEAFNVGLLAGIVVGAGHSLVKTREKGNQIDFLEANQRFLNEKRVRLFTQHEKP